MKVRETQRSEDAEAAADSIAFADPSKAIAFLEPVVQSLAPPKPAPEADKAKTEQTGKAAAPSKPAQPEPSSQPQNLEAYVFVSMEAAHFHLLIGDLSRTKKTIDECQKILDGFDSAELGVNAAFYRVCGDYHKVSLRA